MAKFPDDFERADSGSLGSDWGQPSWNGGSFAIVSGEARDQGSGATEYWQGGGTWGRHQRAEVTANNTSAVRDIFGPAVYVSDNGSYAIRFVSDLGSATFVKYDNAGSYSQLGIGLGSGDTGGVSQAGDVFALEVNDDGSGNSLLSFYRNDTLIDTRTDSSSPYTSGNPGMFGDGAEYEAFEADDFVTGTIVSVLSASETEGATAATAQFNTIVMALAGVETEAALAASPQIAPKVASFTIKDDNGQVVPEATGIQWWSRDARNAAPTDSTDGAGSPASTDAIGDISIELANTTKVVGEIVYIECKLQDGRYGIYEATVS